MTMKLTVNRPREMAVHKGVFILSLISVALLSYACTHTDSNEKEYSRLDCLAGVGDWKEMEALSLQCYGDYIKTCYHNLSLARQGRLAENLFKIRQHGPYGLLYIPEYHASANPCLAHVLFAMGNMAAAQNIAFNSMFTPEGYDYAMMKIVTQVELMRGSDKVANKYIDILKTQREFREWAENARKDPEIERGRKDFPDEEAFVLDSPMEDLFRILDKNPSDSLAMQYGISYLLLAKDIVSTYKFIDRYFGRGALKTLPTPAQEALLFYSDYMQNVEGDDSVDSDWCRSHGVTDETIKRFGRFQQATLSNGGRAPDSFRTTFWHYLLYEQI